MTVLVPYLATKKTRKTTRLTLERSTLEKKLIVKEDIGNIEKGNIQRTKTNFKLDLHKKR